MMAVSYGITYESVLPFTNSISRSRAAFKSLAWSAVLRRIR